MVIHYEYLMEYPQILIPQVAEFLGWKDIKYDASHINEKPKPEAYYATMYGISRTQQTEIHHARREAKYNQYVDSKNRTFNAFKTYKASTSTSTSNAEKKNAEKKKINERTRNGLHTEKERARTERHRSRQQPIAMNPKSSAHNKNLIKNTKYRNPHFKNHITKLKHEHDRQNVWAQSHTPYQRSKSGSSSRTNQKGPWRGRGHGSGRRLMGYHGHEDHYNNTSYTVSLVRTAEAEAWRLSYEKQLTSQPLNNNVARQVDHLHSRLANFCYSFYTLNVLITSTKGSGPTKDHIDNSCHDKNKVWRRSKSNLPS